MNESENFRFINKVSYVPSLLSDLNKINSKIPFNQLPVFIFSFENIKRKSPFFRKEILLKLLLKISESFMIN